MRRVLSLFYLRVEVGMRRVLSSFFSEIKVGMRRVLSPFFGRNGERGRRSLCAKWCLFFLFYVSFLLKTVVIPALFLS